MQSLAPHVDAVFGTRQLRELGDRLVDWVPEFETDGDDGIGCRSHHRRLAERPTPSRDRSQHFAPSSTCSAAVRTTARFASCRTFAAASITARWTTFCAMSAPAYPRARAKSCWSVKPSTPGKIRYAAAISAICAGRPVRSKD